MNKQVKQLSDAIQDEIDAFVSNGCNFSAFTITKNIRAKVNAEVLEIDGLPFETIGGVNTQNIEHDTVRSIVHQICGFNNIAGYERHFVNDSTKRGSGYYEWGPVGTAQSQTSSTTVSAITTGNSTPSTSKPVPADPNDPVVCGKVLNYWDHRFNNGNPATLHSTQRCLKRNPLSIAQIRQIAVDNNYVVEPVTGKPESESIVKPAKQSFISSVVMTIQNGQAVPQVNRKFV